MRVALGLALLGAAAGCGGGSGDADRPGAAADPAPTATPRANGRAGDEDRGRAPARDVAVIRRWADTLRSGDVAGASEAFALPTVVSNGAGPVKLLTRSAVRAFNRTLPCGARLVKAEREGGYVAATFRLTERPGGDCAGGAGNSARTAFRIRDGRIVEWRRLLDAPAPPTETA